MAKKKNIKGKSAQVEKMNANELIKKKANEIYINRIEKGIPGDADSDLLQARNELMN